jgi:DNA replication protein DnaC
VRQDLPVGHPSFGKISVCECRLREVADQVRDRLFSLSNLDELSHLTFETFRLRGRDALGELQAQSLEWAFNHARQFAGALKGWLLLQGGYGCGKTHLAAAIANFAVQMGVPTLFLTVPDLLDNLRFAYDSNDTTFEQRFEQIRNAQLLVMDDFGTQNATDWAREKLFQIINYRYINHLPIVITTNLAMEEIEARIRSRLQDPELVTIVRINVPDYRRPTTDLGHPELSSLDLFSNKTFETLLERTNENLAPEDIKSLKDVIKEAKKYAQKPNGWFVITGTYGCGKTHIAAAIANYQAHLGAPPLFIMAHDLLDHLRAAFNPSSGTRYDRRFDEVRTSPLLILDDLGAQSATPWAKEKLNQLFAYRYNAELPTVITVATDALPELEKRISVKILDESISTLYRISVPAFRGSKEKRKIRKYL